MENQPVEIILQQLVFMNSHDIDNMKKTSKFMNNLIIENEDYIYHQKILLYIKKFNNNKDLYYNIQKINQELLKTAITKNDVNQIKLFLDLGIDIHVENYFALRRSAKNGHTEIVKLLIESGADIHANNDEALRSNASNGHTEIAKLLIESGSNND